MSPFLDIIQKTIEHLLISIGGVTLAMIIGMLIGIFLTRARKLATPVISVIEVLQTVPSMAMLAILMIFFGLGNMTAVIAIFMYSLLPIVRNTYTAILSVPPMLIEAGRGMGMSNLQLLYKVEVPNALPVIISGVRVSLITAYGIVTISVLVGGGGLGGFVYRGAQSSNMTMLLKGAIPICILAIGTDLLFNKIEQFMVRFSK